MVADDCAGAVHEQGAQVLTPTFTDALLTIRSGPRRAKVILASAACYAGRMKTAFGVAEVDRAMLESWLRAPTAGAAVGSFAQHSGGLATALPQRGTR